ncbi:MAG: DUF1801 domain-containing protein [Tabrizicola sp.]|nr:DUF1801 domain-containing protein [Tabrizicola sp.]
MPPMSSEVAAQFAATSPSAREGMLALRQMVFATAAGTPGVGPLTEALRWGQPAYLTQETGAGSSLRIGPFGPGFALFVHCQTSLIADFLSGPGAGFRTSGSRAVVFDSIGDLDPGPISGLIRTALTWHLRGRKTMRSRGKTGRST